VSLRECWVVGWFVCGVKDRFYWKHNLITFGYFLLFLVCLWLWIVGVVVSFLLVFELFLIVQFVSALVFGCGCDGFDVGFGVCLVEVCWKVIVFWVNLTCSALCCRLYMSCKKYTLVIA